MTAADCDAGSAMAGGAVTLPGRPASARVLRRIDSGAPDSRGRHCALSDGHDRPRSDSAEMAAVRSTTSVAGGISRPSRRQRRDCRRARDHRYRSTIRRGFDELEEPDPPEGRVRPIRH